MNYFVVGGLLSNNDNLVSIANNRFRKHSKSFPMKSKERRVIFTEFKSTLIDNSYPTLKREMLKCIVNSESTIVYAYCKINDRKLVQKDKEYIYIYIYIYIELLSRIVKNIDAEIVVYFDSFKKKNFEDRIKTTIIKYENVVAIDNKDSLNNKGIQFADNVCSVIRRHLNNIDDNDYFKIIADKVYCLND